MVARLSNTRPASRRAFTLIELLVVMGVIALLMALLVPTLSKIREQVNIGRVEATIEGVSMALDMYKDVYKRYPPDELFQVRAAPPAVPANMTIASSQSLVYYLSGKSIYYDPVTSPDDYPWKHDLYNTSQDAPGRKNMTVFYSFNSNLLKNYGDDAPALIDPWQRAIIYNSGPGTDPNDPAWPDPYVNEDQYNLFGAAKHGEGKFDIFSAGPDNVYGSEDDVTNWRDQKEWGYDAFNCLNGGGQ